MAQDHVSYVDHISVISVGHEAAPLAVWVPPLGMTKDDMRPVLESLAGAGFRAVSLDPWQHGERGTESADEIRARGSPTSGVICGRSSGRQPSTACASSTTSAVGPSLPAAPRWAATPPSR